MGATSNQRLPVPNIQFVLLVLGCMVIVGFVKKQDATEERTKEYALKASWLTKFIKYVEWPSADNGEPIVIGILGNDPFGKLFAPVEGKSFLGRTLVIHRFGPYQPGMAFPKCQLLFIAESEQAHIESILGEFSRRPVLTVSEFRGFADVGGVINFLPIRRDHIRYEVNQGQAEAVGLRVTSPLLRYADRVIADRQGPRRLP
jgi:YfiR/HmsC-like